MFKDNIQISIITLTKNDINKFIKTLHSINTQTQKVEIEWLIIDGSTNSKDIELTIYKELKNNFSNSFFIRHIQSNKLNLNGIYPSMNYAKKISRGDFIIFLNSGDEFYESNSLEKLFKYSKTITTKSSLIFGQANIISPNKLKWNFPDKKLRNIVLWLKFFEPNHQAMLISRKLSNDFDFSEKYGLVADGYWKRKILENAEEIIYLNYPVSKFYLDGVSSIKPTKLNLTKIISNKNISPLRKLIFIVKFLVPSNLFFFYNYFQKLKSDVVNLIF